MSLPDWLRFAALCILSIWLALRYVRAGAWRGRREALIPALVAVLSLAQMIAEAQLAGDSSSTVGQMLELLALSGYGVVSIAVLIGSAALAIALWRQGAPSGAANPAQGCRQSWPLLATRAALLVMAGGASVMSGPAESAASSAGEIVMSPTLSVPRAALALKNPVANDPASAGRGRTIYEQTCQVCHGITGAGNGPAGVNLRIRPASFRNPQHYQAPGMDGAHFWVIQHGDGRPDGMPAWQGQLTDQQMWDVLNYVKTLAAGTTESSSK